MWNPITNLILLLVRGNNIQYTHFVACKQIFMFLPLQVHVPAGVLCLLQWKSGGWRGVAPHWPNQKVMSTWEVLENEFPIALLKCSKITCMSLLSCTLTDLDLWGPLELFHFKFSCIYLKNSTFRFLTLDPICLCHALNTLLADALMNRHYFLVWLMLHSLSFISEISVQF